MASPTATPPPIDLTAEITLDPPVPNPDEACTIQVNLRNRGSVAARTGFRTYLYVDPPDRPPNLNTPDTYWWYLPGLGAGASSRLDRSHTFTTTGCNHIVYVWVDRDNSVREMDETNNLVSTQVCVGVQCQADTFEADNTCSTAQWIAPGVTQTHTFCPVGDEDWVKLTAIGGMTYTLQALNLGPHADPVLSLYTSCGGLGQFGTGPQIEWRAPANGVYYVQSRHRQTSYGPLASYDLLLSVTGGAADIYEPDDHCTQARDIPTDGSRQHHLFQAAGDHDWVRFTVNSGESFSLVADNVGPGVTPLIALYSACNAALGQPVTAQNYLQATAATGHTYYAEITNQNPNRFGPDARYDLAVRTIPCVADPQEEDDSAATARPMLTTGESRTYNTCPAGDPDWVRFTAEAGTLYVIQTTNLGIAGDTELHLYDTDGITELAHNDDYGYTPASRIIWTAPRDGLFYVKAHHHNPNAAGADTRYDLAISKGRCTPDAFEPDNGPLDARPAVSDGQPRQYNFCPGSGQWSVAGAQPSTHYLLPTISYPLSTDNYSDQDWVRFDAVGGATYVIRTANLGPNSDTRLNLYDRDRTTLLASNDDYGPGRASALSVTLPASGAYYIQVVQYNTSYVGSGTDYQLTISGQIPPTPTPSPTPTLTPTPTPSPTPQLDQLKTLILVNRQRMNDLYSTAETDALMIKLLRLADHPQVRGMVLAVENDPAVAAAYAQWTSDLTSLLDVNKANAVASAVRNLVLSFQDLSPNLAYIVIVGDDRVIPHRRVPEGPLAKTEQSYAITLTQNTPLWAALQANTTPTDDYYADKIPTQWQGNEVYIPDYAVGRLIETPGEISAFIDAFLANDVTTASRALVTGYDFVQDAGSAISQILANDSVETDDDLIGFSWSGDTLRLKQLQAVPRFDLQSINGHATHISSGVPDHRDIYASEVITATSDFTRAVIFSIGCHSGVNDPGVLDLPQAFAQKRANYIGNTGYGWGGGGIVYSEALMRTFTRELLRGTTNTIGNALATAKRRYYERVQVFDAYDAKVLMESTLYGLPMYQVVTGGTLSDEDPFPSVVLTSTTPSTFGDVSTGRIDYGLAGSFAAFDEETGSAGTTIALNGNVNFSAGSPVQPLFFANATSPQAGALHGVVFLGGVYTTVPAFNPVVALAYNEYVTSTREPTFTAPGWYPGTLFQVRTNSTVSTTTENLVTLLGQFNSSASAERLYDRMSFGTFYSNSPDVDPPIITHIDGVLNPAAGLGIIKVEASDDEAINRVVVAYTDGQGVWYSRDLTYNSAAYKWTGVITGTATTRFFVQAVDSAGNVTVDDNKGQYHLLASPLPLIEGRAPSRLYLPLTLKGAGSW